MEKSDSDKNRLALNQRRWINSEKGKAYKRSQSHKDSVKKYNAKRREYDRKHRDETVALIRKIKLERGCKRCGYKEHFIALEFHHRNPDEKRFRLGDCRNYSLKSVMAEIEKCDVLCSNCHAIVEFGD